LPSAPRQTSTTPTALAHDHPDLAVGVGPHREAGAHGPHPHVAGHHHERPAGILGDVEQGLALQQLDPSQLAVESRADRGVGVEGHGRAVAERRAADVALGGSHPPLQSQPAIADRPDHRGGRQQAATHQQASAIGGARDWMGGGREVFAQATGAVQMGADGQGLGIGAGPAGILRRPGLESGLVLVRQRPPIDARGPGGRGGVNVGAAFSGRGQLG
jgi:hypothetical protein